MKESRSGGHFRTVPRSTINIPMMNEKDGKNARKGIPLSKIYAGTGGKGAGKQGARRHVTGSDTACLSIRTPARTN